MKNWKEFISAIVSMIIVCLMSTTIIIFGSDISRLNSSVKNLETQQHFLNEGQKVLFERCSQKDDPTSIYDPRNWDTSNVVIDSMVDSFHCPNWMVESIEKDGSITWTWRRNAENK